MGMVLTADVLYKGITLHHTLEKVRHDHNRLVVDRDNQYCGAHRDRGPVVR